MIALLAVGGVICVIFTVVLLVLLRTRRQARREAYIRSFAFPRGLYAQILKRHPHLQEKELALLNHGLRQFFLAYLKSDYQFVSMPSQVADDLWHEFILYTRNYQQFCEKAFGRFLHHTPAAVLSNNKQSNTGLRRCWKWACKEENISPVSPSRLPLLFALDSKLAIAGGFLYTVDCSGWRERKLENDRDDRHPDNTTAGVVHCAGDFSSSSYDGGTSGLSDSASGGGGD